MTQALLSDLARVKAVFQLRAIMLHMGIEPLAAPHCGDESVSARQTLSSPSGHVADLRGTAASNIVSPDPVETITHTDRTEGVTHRDLSQHAKACVTDRNEIVVPHGSLR